MIFVISATSSIQIDTRKQIKDKNIFLIPGGYPRHQKLWSHISKFWPHRKTQKGVPINVQVLSWVRSREMKNSETANPPLLSAKNNLLAKRRRENDCRQYDCDSFWPMIHIKYIVECHSTATKVISLFSLRYISVCGISWADRPVVLQNWLVTDQWSFANWLVYIYIFSWQWNITNSTDSVFTYGMSQKSLPLKFFVYLCYLTLSTILSFKW